MKGWKGSGMKEVLVVVVVVAVVTDVTDCSVDNADENGPRCIRIQ